jgi:PAS domain S-box-containing protein
VNVESVDDFVKNFAEKSDMGILIIQRGNIKYLNEKFIDLFGYSREEISNWKKREFYKIMHPDDLKNIFQNLKFEGNKTLSVRIRGITKENQIILIENFACQVDYFHKRAVLSSYAIIPNINELRVNEQSTRISINFSEKDLEIIRIIALLKNQTIEAYIEDEIKGITKCYLKNCRSLL